MSTQVDGYAELSQSPTGRLSPRPDALIMVEKSMLKRLSSDMADFKVGTH